MVTLDTCLKSICLLLSITTISVDAFLLPKRNELSGKDDYRVNPDDVPGLKQIEDKTTIPEMYAGHIPLFNGDQSMRFDDDEESDDNNNNVPEDYGYFFWKFNDESPKYKETNKNTLIFWLNGGPGCSSMDGALIESGPLRIDSDGKAHINKGSWASRGDIVFVDQPVGTGFSSIKQKLKQDTKLKLDDNLDLVSLHFCQFLINYFKIFPEDLEKDIILSGESYAGQYIPFIASMVQKNNLMENVEAFPLLQENLPNIKLDTILIGNGWIDPTTQSLSYLPFAMESNLIDTQNPGFSKLLHTHENCQKKINTKADDAINSKFSIPECDLIINDLLEFTKTKDSSGNDQCINVYDYGLRDSYPACGMNWPVDVSHVTKFFSIQNVREALHINSVWAAENWIECRKDVMDHMTNEGSRPSIHLLPSLLENGLNIVLFNGDKDLICNNKGIQDMINNMNWGNHKGFSEDVQNYNWVYRRDDNHNLDEHVGFVQYERNLTFISVYNASHMVPHDKNEISRGIVDIALDNVLLESINQRQTLVSSDIPYTEDYFESSEEEYNDDQESENKDENDNDNNEPSEDTEDEDNGYKTKQAKIFAIFGILILFVVGGIFSMDYWWPKVRGSFGGPYSRLDHPNKTVTWADETNPNTDFELGDMHNDEEFEIGDEQEEEDAEDVEDDDEGCNSDVSDLNIGDNDSLDLESAE